MQNLIEYEIRKTPTNAWGLTNGFSIAPRFDDNADWTDMCNKCTRKYKPFSEANRDEMAKKVEPWMRLIVEIGVSRDGWEESSTKVLVDNKHPDCHCLGIDIEDRSWIKPKGTNIDFICGSSWNVDAILKELSDRGYHNIDFLHIDGDHSVNAVTLEWNYAKLVSKNGIIALHDTNFHPGPWCLVESVDRELFDVEKTCVSFDDYGLAFLRKL